MTPSNDFFMSIEGIELEYSRRSK